LDFQIISKIVPKGGHIINIADRTSLGRHYQGYLPYIVTKSAVSAMTKSLATELAKKGIFVNAIAPGPILRPEDITKKDWQKIRDESPVKYKITDKEAVDQFSELVLYLSQVSMASGYTYPLDQGQNL
jgi:NAD(P)-dependent dehydrogenase (short-subunit alcohol dehydrogenase family)